MALPELPSSALRADEGPAKPPLVWPQRTLSARAGRWLTVLTSVTALNVETGLESRSHRPVTSCDRHAGRQGHRSGSGTTPCKLTTHCTECHSLMRTDKREGPQGSRPLLSEAVTALAGWGGVGDGALPGPALRVGRWPCAWVQVEAGPQGPRGRGP